MGPQAGGERRAAVPSGAARRLHPEYVALAVAREGGDSAFSSPRSASGHPAGATVRIQEGSGALFRWNLKR